MPQPDRGCSPLQRGSLKTEGLGDGRLPVAFRTLQPLYRFELQDGLHVSRAVHRLFRSYQGVHAKYAYLHVLHLDRLTCQLNLVKIPNTVNEAQAIQLADVGIEIQVLELRAGLLCKSELFALRCHPVNGVQIADGSLQ